MKFCERNLGSSQAISCDLWYQVQLQCSAGSSRIISLAIGWRDFFTVQTKVHLLLDIHRNLNHTRCFKLRLNIKKETIWLSSSSCSTLYNEIILIKSCVFSKDVYTTQFQDPTLNGARISLTSKLDGTCSFYWFQGIQNDEVEATSSGIISTQKFVKIVQLYLRKYLQWAQRSHKPFS